MVIFRVLGRKSKEMKRKIKGKLRRPRAEQSIIKHEYVE